MAQGVVRDVVVTVHQLLTWSVVQAKAMSAFLSGEMKDTVQINPAGAYGECQL